MLFAAALAWAITVRDALDMGNMPGTMGMSLVGFNVMWTIMMAAMMLPSLAPVASVYLRTIANQSRGIIYYFRVGSFIIAYLLVWAVFGVLAYAIAWLLGLLIEESPGTLIQVAAVVLVLCGAYQFTPLKDICLKHCRSPISFLFHFGKYHGRLQDFRVGMYHGGFCTGCCAGLMIVMVIAGVMNIFWMIALAVIIFVEKIWRYGKEFSYCIGLILIVLGCLLPWHPYLLRGL